MKSETCFAQTERYFALKNRTIRMNQELTAIHQEVIINFESIHGAFLRMNRSIQAERTSGVLK